MKIHSIFGGEPVILQPDGRPVVSYSYDKRAAVPVQEAGDRFDDGQLYARIMLSCVEVVPEGRLELNRRRFAAVHQVDGSAFTRLLRPVRGCRLQFLVSLADDPGDNLAPTL